MAVSSLMLEIPLASQVPQVTKAIMYARLVGISTQTLFLGRFLLARLDLLQRSSTQITTVLDVAC